MQAKLDPYLQAWNLSDPQPLAQTPTSHLYTVQHEGMTVVLKLLTDYGWEEQRGAAALRIWDGRGAIRLYRSDEKAQLLEYADGDDLVPMVERGEDEEATRIIAGVIRQLHSAPQDKPKDGLYPLDRWFRALFDKAAVDREAGDETVYMRGAAVAARLLADPREMRVLHGDIHHANIRHSARRGWLAFDPKGVVGERTYDCANTLCNPFLGMRGYDPLVHNAARLLRNAGILSEELGIDLARILAYTFAYSCLSAAWSLSSEVENEGAPQWALNIAEIVEPHLAR